MPGVYAGLTTADVCTRLALTIPLKLAMGAWTFIIDEAVTLATEQLTFNMLAVCTVTPLASILIEVPSVLTSTWAGSILIVLPLAVWSVIMPGWSLNSSFCPFLVVIVIVP